MIESRLDINYTPVPLTSNPHNDKEFLEQERFGILNNNFKYWEITLINVEILKIEKTFVVSKTKI